MKPTDIIRFASGNPLLLFDETAEAALRPSLNELRDYPASPSNFWWKKFSEEKVPDFLLARELAPPSGVTARNITFSNGVLHGVTLATDYFLRQTNKLNIARQAQGLPSLKPAVLAPVPTYTFPFNHMQDNDIEIIHVARNKSDNWSLKPEHVEASLRDVRQEGKYLVMNWYESNPNNPSGHIRDTVETETLAEIFEDHNTQMDLLDKPVQCGLYGNPQTSKLTHRMRILDDMIYLGLEYAWKTPASFIANPRTSNDTVLLLGISKYGLPGLRGGLMIAKETLRSALFTQYWQTTGYANITSLNAVTRTFSGIPQHRDVVENHLGRLNRAHKHGLDLAQALVQEQDESFFGKPENHAVIRDIYSNIRDPAAARKRILEGIPGLSLSQPEAGFFTLLDCSPLQGMMLPKNLAGLGVRHGGQAIQGVSSLHKLLCATGVEALRGDTCGLPSTQLVERVSFGLPSRDMITGFERIRQAVTSLTPGKHKKLGLGTNA